MEKEQPTDGQLTLTQVRERAGQKHKPYTQANFRAVLQDWVVACDIPFNVTFRAEH